MPGAAVIFNLNTVPGPTPASPAQEIVTPKKKRTGGGGWPASNLYDLADDDFNHPYYDNEAADTIADENMLVNLAKLLATMERKDNPSTPRFVREEDVSGLSLLGADEAANTEETPLSDAATAIIGAAVIGFFLLF